MFIDWINSQKRILSLWWARNYTLQMIIHINHRNYCLSTSLIVNKASFTLMMIHNTIIAIIILKTLVEWESCFTATRLSLSRLLVSFFFLKKIKEEEATPIKNNQIITVVKRHKFSQMEDHRFEHYSGQAKNSPNNQSCKSLQIVFGGWWGIEIVDKKGI